MSFGLLEADAEKCNTYYLFTSKVAIDATIDCCVFVYGMLHNTDKSHH